MVDWRYIALCVVAGIASVAGFQYAYVAGIGAAINTPSAKLEGEVAKLEREAAKKHPGVSRTQGLALVAAEKASQELNAIADPKERSFKAAQIFLGYYQINARARAEYCQKQGADISPFVTAFTQQYSREYRLASEILLKRGVDPDKAYRQVQDAMQRLITTEMQTLGGFSASHKKVCESFARQPGFYLNQIDLQRRQPDVYRYLWPA